MMNGAAALHPDVERQVVKPRPRRPVKIKPVLTTDGAMATHFAELRISSGIPRSAFAISSSKLTAACRRFAVSEDSSAASVRGAEKYPKAKTTTVNFLNCILNLLRTPAETKVS